MTGGVYRQGSLHQAHFINPKGKFNIVSRLIYLPKSDTMALSDGAPSNTISLASAVNFTFHKSHIFTMAALSETSLQSMNSLGSQATAMVSAEQPVDFATRPLFVSWLRGGVVIPFYLLLYFLVSLHEDFQPRASPWLPW